MSSGIQGPGGPTGPGGPSSPGGPDGPADVDDAPDVDATGGGERASAAGDVAGAERAAAADPVVALAAELDAGRISPDQALARLLDDGLGADLDPAARAELEGLFHDLLASDPYLAGLARDLGAPPLDGGGGEPSGSGGGDGGERR